MKLRIHRYYLLGLPKFMFLRLRREAKERGVSFAALIRLCVSEHFNQIDRDNI